MTLDSPPILTSKQHRECHERWIAWKANFPDRVRLVKSAFEIAEASVRAFGPHLQDLWWIDGKRLYQDVYGTVDPIMHLLDVLNFPDHSSIVDRTKYAAHVSALIREHEDYGSDGNYMPRSVILGWVVRQHDLILSDINEAA